MRPMLLALVFVVASAIAGPTPSIGKSRLDAEKIMSDVYNLKDVDDIGDLNISPDIYDDILNQFRRFEKDFPGEDKESNITEIEEGVTEPSE